MGRLIAVIDGLPGSGKGYVCNIFAKAGFKVADLDDFSQKQLTNPLAQNSCSSFKKVFSIVAQKIKRFVKKQKQDVVLCGVSTMLFDETGNCKVPIHGCHQKCKKIWLEVAPKRGYILNKRMQKKIQTIPELKRVSKTIIMDLLESTRRACVREFRKKEVKIWKSWTSQQRIEEGSFWCLPRPGQKDGPIHIPRNGADQQDVIDLIVMDLNSFIVKYYKYMTAMLDIQIEDGVHKNRTRALKNNFRPMRLEKIMKEFNL